MNETLLLLTDFLEGYAEDLILGLGMLVLLAISYFIPKYIFLKFIYVSLKKKANKIDDILIKHKVLTIVYTLPPVFVVYYAMSYFPGLEQHLQRILNSYITIIVMIFIVRMTKAGNEFYEQFPISATRPIKGYLQLVEIFIVIVGVILAACAFLGKSPWVIVSGVGAMTAILMLVFKDTIMNFVASILIFFDDLVHVGDWIEVPGTGADGTVVDMALHMIKVQNFDKTIVTVPTYKLMEGSFKNWRGMTESGGRRIKRSLFIDQKSVHFLTPEDIKRCYEIDVLKDYITDKLAELKVANKNVSGDTLVNGRHLTNLGTFRAYVLGYLSNRSGIDKNMTLMVRQLSPTPQGLPLEIYVFTSTTEWISYEEIQSDIFDHLLAIIDEFGLRLFQSPSGYDVSEAANKLQLREQK